MGERGRHELDECVQGILAFSEELQMRIADSSSDIAAT